MLPSCLGRGITFVLGQVRLAEHFADAFEEVLRRCRIGYPATILRLTGSPGPANMLQSAALPYHALPPIPGCGMFQGAKGRFIQGGVDPLPLPVASRWRSAANTPKAVNRPVI